ncbi:hypothetical protein VNI00_014031 [Paramarasmius palmivorus]|uniref:BZIP domain-containing protein n=1 Tax=Paramarasmius palmivorus TaxID=297713 RepID=A0AAW0BWK8_9AGAR
MPRKRLYNTPAEKREANRLKAARFYARHKDTINKRRRKSFGVIESLESEGVNVEFETESVRKMMPTETMSPEGVGARRVQKKMTRSHIRLVKTESMPASCEPMPTPESEPYKEDVPSDSLGSPCHYDYDDYDDYVSKERYSSPACGGDNDDYDDYVSKEKYSSPACSPCGDYDDYDDYVSKERYSSPACGPYGDNENDGNDDGNDDSNDDSSNDHDDIKERYSSPSVSCHEPPSPCQTTDDSKESDSSPSSDYEPPSSADPLNVSVDRQARTIPPATFCIDPTVIQSSRIEDTWLAEAQVLLTALRTLYRSVGASKRREFLPKVLEHHLEHLERGYDSFIYDKHEELAEIEIELIHLYDRLYFRHEVGARSVRRVQERITELRGDLGSMALRGLHSTEELVDDYRNGRVDYLKG